MSTELANVESKALEVINPAIAKAAESASIMDAIGTETPLMPIDEAFRYRIARLGKIHLGIKVVGKTKEGKEYERPSATDYFVLPEKLLKDQEFREALIEKGIDPDKPKALPIMLLRNRIGDDTITSFDYWGSSKGLVCRSYDHQQCQRVNPKTLEMESLPCPGEHCTDWIAKRCQCITRIRFMLPDAKGLGVWQLDTHSKNSRTGILSEMMGIKMMTGGLLAGIELLIELVPEVKHIPLTDFKGNKKIGDDGNAILSATTIHVVHISADISPRKAERIKRELKGKTNEYEDIEPIDMDLDEGEVISCDENGEVIENPADTPTQRENASEPIPDNQSVVSEGTTSVSDPLATREQLTELKSLWAMQFVDDNTAGNAWAKGLLGKKFDTKNLTELEATMLISDLEASLTPPEDDEPIDAEYTDSLEI